MADEGNGPAAISSSDGKPATCAPHRWLLAVTSPHCPVQGPPRGQEPGFWLGLGSRDVGRGVGVRSSVQVPPPRKETRLDSG